jgi:hypothetical protein
MFVIVVKLDQLITFPEGISKCDFSQSHELSQRGEFLQKIGQKSIPIDHRQFPTVFKWSDRKPLVLFDDQIKI